MGKKRQGREKFVPPKPLYVESDTTDDARPPVLEYLARHYRSQYDLEKIKVYNNHAMDTCYNLPLEDVTEHFETKAHQDAVAWATRQLSQIAPVTAVTREPRARITPSGNAGVGGGTASPSVPLCGDMGTSVAQIGRSVAKRVSTGDRGPRGEDTTWLSSK